MSRGCDDSMDDSGAMHTIGRNPRGRSITGEKALHGRRASPYLLLLIPLVLIVAGQSCAKLAGILVSESRAYLALISAAGTYLFFGLRGAIWAVIIKKMKLSVAYPVLSLSFPLVLLLSWLVFGEHVSPYNAAGAFIVVFGVVLISRGEMRLREKE